jgi:anti-anti-sigma factor
MTNLDETPLPVPFQIREGVDPDGFARLCLEGELDLAVTELVAARLSRLRSEGAPVRLDLSKLSFMDSTGFQCLYEGVRAAREAECRLEVMDELMPQVRRLIDLVDGGRLLWPSADENRSG